MFLVELFPLAYADVVFSDEAVVIRRLLFEDHFLVTAFFVDDEGAFYFHEEFSVYSMKVIRKKSRDPRPTRRTIALFGGAFNPPHQGHVSMVRILLKQKEIDQVWVLPVWRHPFAKDLVPFKTRLAMCHLAFSGLSKRVTVKRIEAQLQGTSYTVRTLKSLTKRYPGTRFMLVIGADSYKRRKRWKKFETVEQLADLIVFPRGPKSTIPNVSSTDFRTQQRLARSSEALLPRSVDAYIVRNSVYS